MLDLLFTVLALLFMGVGVLLGITVLMLPVYFWAMIRTDEMLAEARRLKLLE